RAATSAGPCAPPPHPRCRGQLRNRSAASRVTAPDTESNRRPVVPAARSYAVERGQEVGRHLAEVAHAGQPSEGFIEARDAGLGADLRARALRDEPPAVDDDDARADPFDDLEDVR